MNKRKCWSAACALLVLGRTLEGGLGAEGTESSSPLPESLDRAYYYEVVRHLFRWYWDEAEAQSMVETGDLVLQVRELHPELDPGDRSRLIQMVFPAFGITVTAKKADYAVEELDLTVKNDTFKIVNVARGAMPPSLDDYTRVTIDYQGIKEYVFRTRNRVRFPEGELFLRMRLAARGRLTRYLEGRGMELPKERQRIYLSPLSPVANEVWVFWEDGRMLMRFSSDIDLEQATLWEHDELSVKIFNVEEQTVVSLHEVAGSNAYLTRDQVGRALFNCVILGRRLDLDPPSE